MSGMQIQPCSPECHKLATKVILILKVVLGGRKKADGKWLNFWVKIYGINFFE